MGETILGQLADQRGAIIATRNRAGDAQDNLSLSNRLIIRMSNRAFWMRLWLCSILLLLLAGVGVIIYLKWGPQPAPHPASPPPPLPARYYEAVPPLRTQPVPMEGPAASLTALQQPAQQQPLPQQPLPLTVDSVRPPSSEGEGGVGGGGRRLQTTSGAEQRGIGTGIILLLVFGIAAAVACCFAAPKSNITRICTCFIAGFLYLALLLFLLLLPREQLPVPGAAVVPVEKEPLDLLIIPRVLTVILIGICMLCGFIAVMTNIAMTRQRAPVIFETESAEHGRLATKA